METVKLEAQAREDTGTGACRRLRRDGLVPGIVYGQGMEAAAIAVPSKALWEALHTHQGANVLVDLQVEGVKHTSEVAAMIKEVQRDPVKRQPVHVDFQWISLSETVRVRVPIQVEGDSVGVKEGGALDQIIYEIEVECLPGAIPDVLTIDITELDIHDSRHVSDLVAPEGVTILHETTDTVVTIAAPISLEELEAAVAEEELLGEEGAIGEIPEGAETGEEEETEEQREQEQERE